MSFAQAWAAAEARPLDEEVLDTLARSAMEESEETRALDLLASAARQLDSAHLWHWTGLLQRALDDHVEAFASLSEALRLDSANQGIAQALAQTSLEAGWDSVAAFEKAAKLGPPSSDILLGLAAARFARGEGQQAADEIDRILEEVPLWFNGHRQLAQLRAVLGQRERATESFQRALIRSPSDEGLWLALLDHNIAASDFEALDENVRRARVAGVVGPLDPYEAVAAGELGDVERADRLFDLPRAPAIWKIRHLLRAGRARDALPIVDEQLAGPDPLPAWPYAAAAWRETGDERYTWLLGADGFVKVLDLTDDLPPIDRLAEVLRSLHHAKGEYLDQSVRGGTQTDGPLFSRTEPEIRQLRTAVLSAVQRYIGDLSAPDPSHPLLGARRDRPVRFGGSWSVRLTGAGFHESHVHSRGWISSALHLVLPNGKESGARENGLLELGSPPSGLKLGQAPIASIEPQAGHLVLFPSWLWHGTRPFGEGERLAVAFDVRRPL